MHLAQLLAITSDLAVEDFERGLEGAAHHADEFVVVDAEAFLGALAEGADRAGSSPESQSELFNDAGRADQDRIGRDA